ncbi:Arm DNA-binding domain-containing protein, partial [Phocaeicola dorei]|uniref:Arm DNA-binding domain-containing protein n=1 Tax=Phocaeicola dorei TaxID=357276 RepID=UPI0035688610
MKVRKELFKSKTLANGEHPIAIRIHHKKAKLVMTGVSTKAEYWNKEKLAVKCQDKKYKEKNKIVNDEYWKIQCKLPPKTKRFCPLKTFNNAPL